jgi:dolichol-phosphate mannosyltransferase
LGGTSVDVIIPTFREVDNVQPLVARLRQVRADSGLLLCVTFVDDDSRDGLEDAVRATGEDWVRAIVRKGERSLSTAVIHGIEQSTHDVIVVMDADLSHPPERIPDLVRRLPEGSDMVFGSRYIAGASTEQGWGLFRWLNSRVATLLARPLTAIRDPMSGFFALRRNTFERAQDLNPVGYKIGLELLVKCNCKRVTEVPIHFGTRVHGKSKLTLAEQLKYIRHLRRLYVHSFTHFSELVQFAVVGASGLLVNLAALTLGLVAGMPGRGAVAFGIGVSITSNFLLNRRFTFSHARHHPFLPQFAHYVATVALGAVVNYGVTLALLSRFPWLLPQSAALVGITAGTQLNYLTAKFVVFREHHAKVTS